MPSLTKANARQHCRTCLAHLGNSSYLPHNKIESKLPVDEMHEFKDISIDIANNDELRQLLAKYIDEKSYTECLEEFPQHLCLGCYNKLQAFEKFHQRALESAERLQALLVPRCAVVTKEELDYESVTESAGSPHQTIAVHQSTDADMYKLLLKDSLMETESVLLDASNVANITTADIHEPDPFDALATTKVFNASSTNTMPEPEFLKNGSEAHSSSYSADEHDSKNLSSQSDIEEDRDGVLEMDTTNVSRLRSGKKFLATKSPTMMLKKKKCRRTKKEMEEWRKAQHDSLDLKAKRRNKGTKNNFKCTQCNHCFAHKITLDAHTRKVHEGSKRPFKCDRCDKSYTFIGGLYTHIKEIHETKVRSYLCDFPDCDRIYTSSIAMQKHKRVKHYEIGLQQKKYVCEQCGATFNQTGNLKYHRRSKHPTAAEQAEKEQSKERYECDVCNKLFHSRYTLKYHTLQLHSNDMKYECNTCGRRMAKKFMLIQHMLVHSTDKMPCEHCGKQFIRKFELEAHIRAVHMKLKPYECQYCSECFASRKTLRHHEYIHTGEKPYVCNICGQAYRQQTCLKNHRKGHEKHNSDASLSVNINRTLLSTFLGAQPVSATQIATANTTLNAFN